MSRHSNLVDFCSRTGPLPRNGHGSQSVLAFLRYACISVVNLFHVSAINSSLSVLKMKVNGTGMVSTVSYAFLGLTSMAYFRRRFYSAFYFVHIPAAWLMLITAVWHYPTVRFDVDRLWYDANSSSRLKGFCPVTVRVDFDTQHGILSVFQHTGLP